MVNPEFELSNHFQPLSNDDSFEIAGSDVDLFSDTPQNSPIGDESRLFQEFEILRQDNAKLFKQNKFLQCQIDNLSAKLLAQEDKIQYLYKKVKNSGSPSNVESDKTSEHQATSDGGNADKLSEGDGTHLMSGEDTELNKATVLNEDTGDTSGCNEKPWSNVCKKYNMGICRRARCRYQHKKVKTCRFYNSASGCSKGIDCNFLHIKSLKQTPESNALAPINPNQGEDLAQIEQTRQQRIFSDNMLASFLDKLESRLINAVQLTALARSQPPANPMIPVQYPVTYQFPETGDHQNFPHQRSMMMQGPHIIQQQ